MTRKKLLIVTVLVFCIGLGITVALFSATRENPLPQTTPTPTPTPSATPLPIDFVVPEDGDAEVTDFYREFPVTRRLPEANKYWDLRVAGALQDDRLPLIATVYYVDGRNTADLMIEQQKPFIIEYVRKSGQPDGTYTIKYEGKAIQDSSGWQ